MIDFILGSVPSWLWIAAAILVVAIIVGVLKGDGWKWAFGVAIAGAVLFFQSRAHQRGAAVERIKQQEADSHAREVIAEKKIDVADDTEDELDARLRKYQR